MSQTKWALLVVALGSTPVLAGPSTAGPPPPVLPPLHTLEAIEVQALLVPGAKKQDPPSLRVVVYADPSMGSASVRVQTSDPALFGGAAFRDLVASPGDGAGIVGFEPWVIHDKGAHGITAITPTAEPFRNGIGETWHATVEASLTKADRLVLQSAGQASLHTELTLTGESDGVDRTVVEDAPVTPKGDGYVADVTWDGRITTDGAKGFLPALPGRVRVQATATLTLCDPKILVACVPITLGREEQFSGVIHVELETMPPRFAVIDTPVDSAYRSKQALARIMTVTTPKAGAQLPLMEALSFGLVHGSFVGTYNQNQATAYAAIQRFLHQYRKAGNSIDPKAGFSAPFVEEPKIGAGDPGAPSPKDALDPSCQVGVDPGCVALTGTVLMDMAMGRTMGGARTPISPTRPCALTPAVDLRGIGDLEVELHEIDGGGNDHVWGRTQTNNNAASAGLFAVAAVLNPSSFYYLRLRTVGTLFHVRYGRTLGSLLFSLPSVGDIIDAIERFVPLDPLTRAHLELLRLLPSLDPLMCILSALAPGTFGPSALYCGGVSNECADAYCYRSAPVRGGSLAAGGNVFPAASLTVSPGNGTAPAPGASLTSLASLDPSEWLLEVHRQAALAERPIADIFGLPQFQSSWTFQHSPVPENPYLSIYAGDFETDMGFCRGVPCTFPFTISAIAVVAAFAELTAAASLLIPDPIAFYNLLRIALIQTNTLGPGDSTSLADIKAGTDPFNEGGYGEWVRHEFGHFVQTHLLGTNPILDVDSGPAGVERLLNCNGHTFGSIDKLPPCAYSEGFANFYAILSSDEDYCSQPDSTPLARAGTYQGNDAEDFQNSFSPPGATLVGTGPTPLGPNGGASTEGRITAALWDWIDLRNDPPCSGATVPGQGNDTAFPGSGDRSLAAPVTAAQVLTALRDAGLAFYIQTSLPIDPNPGADLTRFLRSPIIDVTQHEALMLGNPVVVPPSFALIPLAPPAVLPFAPALIPSTVGLSQPARDYLQLSSTWNFIDSTVPAGDDSAFTHEATPPPPDPTLDVCNLRLHGIDSARIKLTRSGSPVLSPFSCRQLFEVLNGKTGRFGYDFDGGSEVDGNFDGSELLVGAPHTHVTLEDDYHAVVADDPNGGAVYYFTGTEVESTASGDLAPRLFGFNLVTLGAAASISDPGLFTPPPLPGQEVKQELPFQIGERVEVGNWAARPVLVTGGLGVEQDINRITILYFDAAGLALEPFSFWAIDPAEYGIGHANAFDLTDVNADGLDDLVIFGTDGSLIVWGSDRPPRAADASALLHLTPFTGIFPQGEANVVPLYGIDSSHFMGKQARFRAAGGLFDPEAGGQLGMVRNNVTVTGTLGLDPRPDPSGEQAMALVASSANLHQDVPFADYSRGLPLGLVPTGIFVEGPGQLAVFGNAFDVFGVRYLGDRPTFKPFNIPLPVGYCSGCASSTAGPFIPSLPADPVPLWETHRFVDALDFTPTYGLGAVAQAAGARHFLGAAGVGRFNPDSHQYDFAPLGRPPALPETGDEYGRAVDAIAPVISSDGAMASVGVGVPGTVVVGGGAVVCLKNPLLH